jgi:formylglycine-generating enzyme required for sulfatase activity
VGDTFDKTCCNTQENGTGTTTAVGSYPGCESPYHVQDMTGNVWEWTISLFMLYPYRKDDGRENRDDPQNRVLRGGSWRGKAWLARAAYRIHGRPSYRVVNVGFRLAVAGFGSV